MSNSLYNAALVMLARREHSQKELCSKLSFKYSFSPDDLRELLERLRNEGLQCDERFADSYTRSRIRKGFGPERIKMELNEKGISSTIVRSVMDSYEGEWREIAYREWRKKYNTRPADINEQVKQSRFLRYRGFRSCDIREVMQT